MVVVGAFTNISALSTWLEEQDKNVVFLCSGWKGRFNLEDSLFAGAVIDRLSNNYKYAELSDSALASKYLFHTADADPYKFLRNSSHRKRMHKLNLKKDVKYCLTLDQTKIIPVLKGNELVRLEEYYESITS
jgi:2-phosphosulfolactate phosphatase